MSIKCFILILILLFVTYGAFYIYFDSQKEKSFPLSTEFKRKLGVKIIKLPKKEEEELHPMIEKTIETGWDYLCSDNKEGIDKIEDLFLPEEYQKINDGIFVNTVNTENPVCYSGISKIQFSKTRTYQSLENRVGIGCTVSYENPPPHKTDEFLFIFKKEDNQWKIEKCSQHLLSTWEEFEAYLVLTTKKDTE